MIRTALVLCSITILASCICPKPPEVVSVKPEDKALTCGNLVLEINETEFQRKTAQSYKWGTVDHLLNPFCYPATYVSASHTQQAADERLEYLNQIYELMGCDRMPRRPEPFSKQSDIPAGGQK